MKQKTSTALCGLISGVLLLAAGIVNSNAVVSLTFWGMPGSSTINYVLSGSGTFTSTNTLSTFQLRNVSFAAYDEALDGDPIFAITGTGTLANTTTTSSVTLQSIQLDSDGTGAGADDTWLIFNTALSFSNGDTLSITGSGSFDMAGTATFDDMNVGSGTSSNTNFNSFDGIITIAQGIPEPSRALLSLVGIAAIGVRRRRK